MEHIAWAGRHRVLTRSMSKSGTIPGFGCSLTRPSSPQINSGLKSSRGGVAPYSCQQTVIVNRTVVIRESDRTVAVNPGIEPTLIAREIGRPIPVYDVRPVVLAGTAKIEDAIEVRPDEKPRKIEEKLVERTDEAVKPAETDDTRGTCS